MRRFEPWTVIAAFLACSHAHDTADAPAATGEASDPGTPCSATWPAAGRPARTLAPLPSDAPKILWRARVNASWSPEPGLLGDATLAETGDRLALSAGNAIALVEKRSGTAAPDVLDASAVAD
jgi:hypothetical protein